MTPQPNRKNNTQKEPLTRLFLLCQLKFESLIPALLRRAFQLLGLHDELLDGVLLLQLRQNAVDELGQLRVPLLDGDGVAVTGIRDVEIHSGQILLGVREGQQRYKRQQLSNRFFHDVLSPSRFQPERLFPQGLVEEGRSGSGLAHDQLSFCPVFRAPA